nr:PREDICTED: KDEL motif-containing protein 1 [Latimeria chalumnae]|eukprot:XP_005994557.2 PREDICTED: KDEL motif-containing protein 1 [Latimeria chalumnae]
MDPLSFPSVIVIESSVLQCHTLSSAPPSRSLPLQQPRDALGCGTASRTIAPPPLLREAESLSNGGGAMNWGGGLNNTRKLALVFATPRRIFEPRRPRIPVPCTPVAGRWAGMLPVIAWTLLVVLLCTANGDNLSPSHSLVWGPGLEARVVLPARYFYIQAVDSNGQNFTSTPGENVFQVKISASGEQFSRIWVQVLDRKDGSFIVRYRMYASYMKLKIEVTAKNKPVAQSPYVLQGPVYHENCECPQDDTVLWLEDMRCPHSIPQIQKDFAAYSIIDPDKLAKEVPNRFGQRQSLCHYTLKDNKIYIKTHGEHVGFRIFMDATLLSLTRKVKMPDVEFFVNLGDWPLLKKKSRDNLSPILSWCGSNDTKDIVMPTYDLTESVLETMGRVSLDMMSVQANTGPAWEEKNSTAFWRGRDSRKERLELVKLGRKHRDLIDAAFTNFFFFKHDESLYGPLVKHVSFFDFFKYKYQVSIDGTVAAYRLPYLLAGDSVVLKQDSSYYEHFYNELQPWVHYIPFKRDLSDLLEKIKWAKEHDEEVILIGLLSLFDGEYANLQVTEPKVRDGMELVEQPKDDLFPCTCHRKQMRDEL